MFSAAWFWDDGTSYAAEHGVCPDQNSGYYYD